jgi:hypothetical protein
VVGRQTYSRFPDSGSELLNLLKSVIAVGEFSSSDGKTAGSHLAAYVNDPAGFERYAGLINAILRPAPDNQYFGLESDVVDDFRTGVEWFRTLPDGADPLSLLSKEAFHRQITFVIRTFLYLAYADENEIPFTLDEARAEVLEPVIVAERNLRSKLLEQLKKASDEPALLGNVDVLRNTTPLTAVVFSRASGRAGIAREIIDLREELLATRTRLCEAEDELFWATHDEGVRAFTKWNDVFAELRRRYGEAEGLVSCKGLLGFADKAAKIFLEPTKWPKLVGLPIEIVRRAIARRPIIEIHRLAEELPGSCGLQESIKRLFGEVIDDAPQPRIRGMR